MVEARRKLAAAEAARRAVSEAGAARAKMAACQTAVDQAERLVRGPASRCMLVFVCRRGGRTGVRVRVIVLAVTRHVAAAAARQVKEECRKCGISAADVLLSGGAGGAGGGPSSRKRQREPDAAAEAERNVALRLATGRRGSGGGQ